MDRHAIDDAAATLAAAFVGGPYETHVQPDLDDQRRSLPVMFGGVVRRCHEVGGVETVAVEDGGRPAAVCAWVPASELSPGPAAVWRSGLWRTVLPSAFGPAATWRLLRHEHVTDAALARWATPDTGYLWCLGVDPERHGQGLGRRAVDLGVAAMRRAGLTRCLLKTETPANVALYRHLGFELLEEVADPHAVPAWILRRDG